MSSVTGKRNELAYHWPCLAGSVKEVMSRSGKTAGSSLRFCISKIGLLLLAWLGLPGEE